jgi:hypothetical protein
MDHNENEHEMDDPNQVTTDRLREITKVPAVRSLLKDEKFPLEHIPSERPKWRSPILKLALGGAGLGSVFLVLSLFMSGKQQQAQVETSPQKIAASPNPLTQENARLQKENSKLKVNGALIDQTGIEKRLQALRDGTRNPSTSRAGDRPTSRPTTATAPARPASSPRTVAVAPTPRVQTSPTPVSRPASAARSTPVSPSRSESDPMERWQELARLGSYGSIQPESSPQTDKFAGAGQVNQRVLQAMQNAPYDVASTAVPTARIAPTSAVQDFQPEFSSRFPTTISQPESVVPSDEEENSEADIQAAAELQQDESVTQPEPSAQNPSSSLIAQMPPESPPILEEEEARILESDDRQHALTVGTRAAGELVTPVTIAESRTTDRFTIKLTEPLMDNQGQIALPEGSELVVQVDSVSETGQVHLSAIAATWAIDGQQRELMLPPGAIQVRGEEGEPLVAEHFDDRGEAIAGMDAGQFLLGAAGRAAQLYTRSGSQIQTRGSTTVISEENPDPNILAGLVEGGTDAVLESIQERNQRAIERMEEQPNIRFIETGTEVEIFVNQSMFMPM